MGPCSPREPRAALQLAAESQYEAAGYIIGGQPGMAPGWQITAHISDLHGCLGVRRQSLLPNVAEVAASLSLAHAVHVSLGTKERKMYGCNLALYPNLLATPFVSNAPTVSLSTHFARQHSQHIYISMQHSTSISLQCITTPN